MNQSTSTSSSSPVSREEKSALQENIQKYLEGHVYNGRYGRKMDNG